MAIYSGCYRSARAQRRLSRESKRYRHQNRISVHDRLTVEQRLSTLLIELQCSHPDILHRAPSKTEGYTTDALYAKPDLPAIPEESTTMEYEIAYVHPRERSLHALLSRTDATRVVQADWGQRFPIRSVPNGWVSVPVFSNPTFQAP